MVIIHLKGGLGNQMFQYAFGRNLALKRKTALKLDISDSIKGIKKDTERPYLLDQFNIEADIAAPEEVEKARNSFYLWLAKAWRKFSKYDYFKYDPSFFKSRSHYFEGFWWQSERYFFDIRELLLKEFTLREGFSTEAEKIAESIRQTESPVSIHVRRGDFVHDPATLAHHGLATEEYYQKAIEKITEIHPHAIFFIFSDDVEWVKEHLRLPPLAFFVSGNNLTVPEELSLIALCKHHIIANSSFSWWGAWLSTASKKTVIAPKEWLADNAMNTNDVYPEEWVRL